MFGPLAHWQAEVKAAKVHLRTPPTYPVTLLLVSHLLHAKPCVHRDVQTCMGCLTSLHMQTCTECMDGGGERAERAGLLDQG